MPTPSVFIMLTHSSPPSPTSSIDTFPPLPKRISNNPSRSGLLLGQISLSLNELSALITKTVANAISAHEAKKTIMSFPELPKLKSLPAVWLAILDIGKLFIPHLLYFNGNKKEFFGWWGQVILHLGRYKETPNDTQKIMIVLLLMKGRSAEKFANMFVDMYDLDQYLFKEFKRNLSITFQPADICHKAEQELATLQQKSLESIEEFIL